MLQDHYLSSMRVWFNKAGRVPKWRFELSPSSDLTDDWVEVPPPLQFSLVWARLFLGKHKEMTCDYHTIPYYFWQ